MQREHLNFNTTSSDQSTDMDVDDDELSQWFSEVDSIAETVAMNDDPGFNCYEFESTATTPVDYHWCEGTQQYMDNYRRFIGRQAGTTDVDDFGALGFGDDEWDDEMGAWQRFDPVEATGDDGYDDDLMLGLDPVRDHDWRVGAQDDEEDMSLRTSDHWYDDDERYMDNVEEDWNGRYDRYDAFGGDYGF